MIPIFLASDNKYVPYLCLTMLSILKNTREKIHFFILDGGISKNFKKKIAGLHNKIEFIDMQKFHLERFPNVAHYSINAFSRYFIAGLKPELNRVLYLDVDIIVKSDIKELFEQDLEGYPLGAAIEDFFPKNAQCLKNIHPFDGQYFNSGVLVMELDYFRKNNIEKLLVEKTLELKNCLNCPDQDVLNIIFENNFKVLDYKFNFMPEHLNIKNPVIIHYTGTKPWFNTKTQRAKDFWEIAEISPFYKKLIHDIRLPKLLEKCPSKEHINYLKRFGGFDGIIINLVLYLKLRVPNFTYKL